MQFSSVNFLSEPCPPPCECHGCWHVCDGRSEGSGPGHCALVMAERHHRLPSVHPRDPFLTDSPFCTHHPYPLLGAVERYNSSSIFFWRAAQKYIVCVCVCGAWVLMHKFSDTAVKLRLSQKRVFVADCKEEISCVCVLSPCVLPQPVTV